MTSEDSKATLSVTLTCQNLTKEIEECMYSQIQFYLFIFTNVFLCMSGVTLLGETLHQILCAVLISAGVFQDDEEGAEAQYSDAMWGADMYVYMWIHSSLCLVCSPKQLLGF